jgi:alanine-synthesizing transaminase
MFSSRVRGDLAPNALARAVAARRLAGRPLIDLTATNPAACGIRAPSSTLDALAGAASYRYDPEPFGLLTAREAVSREYARHGMRVAPDRIVLTASTSEGYSLIFKLLCDPGDSVMVPVPSYPLFEHLCRLDGVNTSTYRLEYHGRWNVDAHSAVSSWTDDTRALLAVSPNNPTGSVLTADEEALLRRECASRNAALVVDEVFRDYPLGTAGFPRHDSIGPVPLSFRLGGLSKSAGLPQVKLGWIAVEGPDALVSAALGRLEVICDAYLSVSTPVQVAAPELIARGAGTRLAILQRVQRNHRALAASVAECPSVELLHADGGWSAVLRIPSTTSEERIVLDILECDGVLVHPGFFFDFPREAFLVVSLLPQPDLFDEGVRRVLGRVNG